MFYDDIVSDKLKDCQCPECSNARQLREARANVEPAEKVSSRKQRPKLSATSFVVTMTDRFEDGTEKALLYGAEASETHTTLTYSAQGASISVAVENDSVLANALSFFVKNALKLLTSGTSRTTT